MSHTADSPIGGRPATETIAPRSIRYRLSDAEAAAVIQHSGATPDGVLLHPIRHVGDPLAVLRSAHLVDVGDRLPPFLASAISVAARPERQVHVMITVPGGPDWLELRIGAAAERGPFVTVCQDAHSVDLYALETPMEVAAVLDGMLRLTSYPARPVDPDVALTLPAWVGLLAITDVRRLRRLRDQIRRQPAGQHTVAVTPTDLEGAISVGLAGTDTRWAVTAAVPIAPVALRDRPIQAERALSEMEALGLVSRAGSEYTLTTLGCDLSDLVDQTILIGSLTLTRRRQDREERNGELLIYRAPTRMAIGVWAGTSAAPVLTWIEPTPEAAVAMIHRFLALPDREVSAAAPPSAPPPFEPTHVVPERGLDGLRRPGAGEVVMRLEQSAPIRVLETEGDWSRVVTEPGAMCWVDARLLVPIGAATHRVAAGGAPGWIRPDAGIPASVTIPEGTRLMLLEVSGAWAHVRADDGWEGWVDARRLLPL